MSDTLKIKIARDHEPVRRPSDEAGPRMLTEQADGSFKDSQLIYPGEVLDVPNTRYWRRRIAISDVLEVVEAAKPSPAREVAPARPRVSQKEE